MDNTHIPTALFTTVLLSLLRGFGISGKGHLCQHFRLTINMKRSIHFVRYELLTVNTYSYFHLFIHWRVLCRAQFRSILEAAVMVFPGRGDS